MENLYIEIVATSMPPRPRPRFPLPLPLVPHHVCPTLLNPFALFRRLTQAIDTSIGHMGVAICYFENRIELHLVSRNFPECVIGSINPSPTVLLHLKTRLRRIYLDPALELALQ